MNLRKLFFVVGVFATSLLAGQQTGQTVRSLVTDAFTGSPVRGATVIVEGTSPLVGAVTDDKGEF